MKHVVIAMSVVFVVAVAVVVAQERRGTTGATVKTAKVGRLEIVDAQGRPRIVMECVDKPAPNTARIVFYAPNGKKHLQIVDGGTGGLNRRGLMRIDMSPDLDENQLPGAITIMSADGRCMVNAQDGSEDAKRFP